MKKIMIVTAAATFALSAAAAPLQFNKRLFKAAAEPGLILNEDFEGYQSSTDWLPQGWSIECKGDTHAEGDILGNWHVQPRTSFQLPAPSSGMHYACCFYQSSSTAKSDEWLYTPEISLNQGESLSFYLWIDPGTMFNVPGDAELDDVNNFDVKATFQVWMLPEGDEPVMLEDVADRYKGITLREMYANASNDLLKHTYSLKDYAGKKVKIGFRYVGSDGNAFFLDDVRVSLPDATARYELPWSTLYAGFSLYDENWDYLPQDCAVFPAYTDLTLTADYAPGHNYSWEYQVPGHNSQFSSAEGDELTMTMLPDFSNEATAANSLYSLPALTASGNNLITASYMHPAKIMMAGGNPARHVMDQTTGNDFYINYGLLPFPVNHDGVDIYVEEPMAFGEPGVPIFGYSDRVNEWWFNHFFEGEPEEGDAMRMIGFMNMYFATEQPLVIDKIWVMAKGQYDSNIRLKAQIRALNEDFEDNGDVLAEAFCTAENVMWAQGGVQQFLTLVFPFDEPISVSTQDCPYYIVEISGFENGGVTWLAPEQSYMPDHSGLCRGWVSLEASRGGVTGTTMVPIANFKNEYNENMYNSFAINLGASFPYLRAADETAEAPELSDDCTRVEVPLLSWYPGEQLTVDVPDGFEAAVEGRWNQARLVLTALKDGPAGNFTAKVKCPGIELAVPFSSKGVTVAINDILNDGSARTVTGIFTTDGRDTGITDIARLPEGIYIVRYADGTAAKISR